MKTVVFANGCFWCTEAVFSRIKGVTSVTSGYAGGNMANPSYEQVSSGETGHAECIKIEYDPSLISFEDLLIVFFFTHDPTTLSRQGNDFGTQYRSAIFYTDEEQKKEAVRLIQDLNDRNAYDNPVVTEVLPLKDFYPAEDYHKKYFENNKEKQYCQLVIAPKIAKLEQKFQKILKSGENGV